MVFLVLLSLGRDKDTLAEDEVPGGGGACSAAEGFHQGCLSRSAARRAAERKRGKQQTLSLASACRGKGRTERVCLSGESREKQAAWRSGEERGGTAAAAGTSLGACGGPLLGSHGRGARENRVCTFIRLTGKENHRFCFSGAPQRAPFQVFPSSLYVFFLKARHETD